MRYILRRREWVPDEWRYLEEAHEERTPLIVPWQALRSDPAHWSGRAALGISLQAADAIEDLSALIARVQLVAVEFPNAGDGRGYSQGRLLRERLGFHGELRARGAGVRQDLVFFLARTGFDALELAAGEDVPAALRAYGRYDVAYQPGAAQLPLRRQRFFA
jgi:uncharacterized protein (DUF934 family)